MWSWRSTIVQQRARRRVHQKHSSPIGENKEVADLLAGVDFAREEGNRPIRTGWASAGWSYGGILNRDYTIATESALQRPAISGRGQRETSFPLYGRRPVYPFSTATELGVPMASPSGIVDEGLRNPFFPPAGTGIRNTHLVSWRREGLQTSRSAAASRCTRALRTLGVPTQLVIYSGGSSIFFYGAQLHSRPAWSGSLVVGLTSTEESGIRPPRSDCPAASAGDPPRAGRPSRTGRDTSRFSAPRRSANVLICLINQAGYLRPKTTAELGRTFPFRGRDSSERLFKEAASKHRSSLNTARIHHRSAAVLPSSVFLLYSSPRTNRSAGGRWLILTGDFRQWVRRNTTPASEISFGSMTISPFS